MNAQNLTFHTVVFRDGEKIDIPEIEGKGFPCPVCGFLPKEDPEDSFPVFPPYDPDHNGACSHDICACGFQFGFDDTPSGSGTKIETVEGNWSAWRISWLSRWKSSKDKVYDPAHGDMTVIEAFEQLRNIGIDLHRGNSISKESLRRIVDKLKREQVASGQRR